MKKLYLPTIILALLMAFVLSGCEKNDILEQPVVAPTGVSDPTATTEPGNTAETTPEAIVDPNVVVPELGTYWYDSDDDAIMMIYTTGTYEYISINSGTYDSGIYSPDAAKRGNDSAFYANEKQANVPFTFKDNVLEYRNSKLKQYDEQNFQSIYSNFMQRVNVILWQDFEKCEHKKTVYYEGKGYECTGVWASGVWVLDLYPIDKDHVGLRLMNDGYEVYNGPAEITENEKGYKYHITYDEDKSADFELGLSYTSLIWQQDGEIRIWR